MDPELYARLEKEYALKPGFLKALALVESGGKSDAVSKVKGSTAKGLFQINDPTAKEWGVTDPFNEEQAARATARVAADRFKKYGNWDDVVMAHNVGDKGLASGKGDQNYLKKFKAKFGEDGPEIINVDPAKVRGMVTTKPKKEPTPDPTEGSSFGQNLIEGIGGGMTKLGLGGAQTALGVAGSVFDSDWIKKKQKAVQDAIDENKYLGRHLDATAGGVIGDVVGQTLPMMIVPGGMGAKGLMMAGAKGAGQGLANAALTPRASDEDQGMHWGVNTAGGALVGGALHGAGRGIAAGKQYYKDNLAEPLSRFRASLETGIPTTIGDINPESRWKTIENFLPKVFGSGRAKFQKEQAGSVKEAIQKTADELAPAQGGTNYGQQMFEDLLDTYGKKKGIAKTMYDEVSAAAKQSGVTGVVPNKTVAMYYAMRKEFPTTIKSLNDPKTEQTLEGIANMFGKEGIEKNGLPSFDELRGLRTDIGYLMRQAQKKAARGDLNEKAPTQLSALYAGITEDLNDWGAKSGNENVAKLWQLADTFYKKEIDPWKKIPQLNEIRFLNKDSPYDYDKLIAPLVAKERGVRAGHIVDQLSPEGQKAAASGTFARAMAAARNPNAESGLSTKNLLNSLNTGTTRESIFTPGQATKIGDLETAVRAASRSAEPTEVGMSASRLNPSMGVSNLLGLTPLGAGAAASYYSDSIPGGLGTAAALTMLSRGANKYTSSNLGKRMHLADPTKIPDLDKAHLKEYDAWLKFLSRGAGPAAIDASYEELK